MVTINDVAKKAGVSRGTVSNVINNVKVRPAYKEKVDAAIKELGYIPNAYARGLKSNKTNTIAFILPTVWFPFFSELTNYLEQELRKCGYKMLLCNSQNDYRLELDYIQMAQENKVDGIISITYSDIEPYLNSNLPLVTIERYFNSSIPFISTDNFEGGVQVAKKLVELGCKKLTFIGRFDEKGNVTALRRDGFRSYCKENQLDYEELYVESSSKDFVEEVYQYMNKNYKYGVYRDGIFAATDRYGDYIVDALEKYHCPVQAGTDLQIIGFDGAKSHKNDLIRISSMRQPVVDIAATAVKTIHALINKEPVERYTLLPVTFVQGKTTKGQKH